MSATLALSRLALPSLAWLVVALSLKATYGPSGPEFWVPGSVWPTKKSQRHFTSNETRVAIWMTGNDYGPDEPNTWRSRRFQTVHKRNAVKTFEHIATPSRRPPLFDKYGHEPPPPYRVGFLPPREMLIKMFPGMQELSMIPVSSNAQTKPSSSLPIWPALVMVFCFNPWAIASATRSKNINVECPKRARRHSKESLRPKLPRRHSKELFLPSKHHRAHAQLLLRQPRLR